MRVQTNLLKKLLSYTAKVKANNYLEITNYYELFFSKNGLVLRATDGNNFLTISTGEGSQEEEQRIIVKSEQLTKLIGKTTADVVNLSIKDSYLQVTGNGKYKVELFTDEDYPTYEVESEEVMDINAKALVHAIEIGKNSKGVTPSDGVLFSYLLRDEYLVAADSIKVACAEVPKFINEVLISPSMANILTILDDEQCTVTLDKEHNKIKFSTDTIEIAGPLMEGVEDYPDVLPIIDDSYPISCELDCLSVLRALDRLKIFLGLYDGNIFNLVFTGEALVISTLSGSTETIPYKRLEGEIQEAFLYSVNSNFLIDIVSSIKEPLFEICLGSDEVLKFTSNTDSFLLATAEED